jgi:hypothetical protein
MVILVVVVLLILAILLIGLILSISSNAYAFLGSIGKGIFNVLKGGADDLGRGVGRQVGSSFDDIGRSVGRGTGTSFDNAGSHLQTRLIAPSASAKASNNPVIELSSSSAKGFGKVGTAPTADELVPSMSKFSVYDPVPSFQKRIKFPDGDRSDLSISNTITKIRSSLDIRPIQGESMSLSKTEVANFGSLRDIARPFVDFVLVMIMFR